MTTALREHLTDDDFVKAVDLALDVLDLVSASHQPNVVCYAALLLTAGGIVGVHEPSDMQLASEIWLQLSDEDAWRIFRTGFQTMKEAKARQGRKTQ